jgi:hypothetical protein
LALAAVGGDLPVLIDRAVSRDGEQEVAHVLARIDVEFWQGQHDGCKQRQRSRFDIRSDPTIPPIACFFSEIIGEVFPEMLNVDALRLGEGSWARRVREALLRGGGDLGRRVWIARPHGGETIRPRRSFPSIIVLLPHLCPLADRIV